MTADINIKFWLEARDKPGLLIAMMQLLAGNARISFEGDLTDIDISGFELVSHDETPALRRAAAGPPESFIVLPLETETIRPILDVILPKARIVHAVTHVQIEKDGLLEFGAYDNFHPECIVVGLAVLDTKLNELLTNGVLRAVHPATQNTRDV